MTNFRVKKIKLVDQLIGKTLPTNQNGHAGRMVEHLLEDLGLTINRGHGCDLELLGVEVKTRDIDATSPQTIADMRPDEIIKTQYRDSHVYEKFQQQLRIYTKDNIIISADIFDFSKPSIQELVEEAYNHAREQIRVNPDLIRTEYTGFYGYFERTEHKTGLSFRLSSADMTTLENMSQSTFHQIFEYNEDKN